MPNLQRREKKKREIYASNRRGFLPEVGIRIRLRPIFRELTRESDKRPEWRQKRGKKAQGRTMVR